MEIALTTQRQAKLLFRSIQHRHPGFAPAGVRALYKTPVHHIAGRVLIERTGLADEFRLMWTLSALFLPRVRVDVIVGTYCEHLQRSAASSQRSSPWSKTLTSAEMIELSKASVPMPTWCWSDPTMTDDAIELIETEALPRLHMYGTPEGYVTLPHRPDWVHYEPREDRMLADIAAGDLDAALAIWHEREPLYRDKTFHPEWQSLQHRWQRQLAAVAEPLRAGDRRALADILHGWEAANVRGTSIERYWEPSPFPLERGL